jgi:hypothetical protein
VLIYLLISSFNTRFHKKDPITTKKKKINIITETTELKERVKTRRNSNKKLNTSILKGEDADDVKL